MTSKMRRGGFGRALAKMDKVKKPVKHIPLNTKSKKGKPDE